jgi:hypothetical protein
MGAGVSSEVDDVLKEVSEQDIQQIFAGIPEEQARVLKALETCGSRRVDEKPQDNQNDEIRRLQKEVETLRKSLAELQESPTSRLSSPTNKRHSMGQVAGVTMMREKAKSNLKRNITKSNNGEAQRNPPKTIVVSYSTRQAAFKDLICKEIDSLGLISWSGSDVKPGGDWREQWADKVYEKDTLGVVFILSRSFFLSPACKDELQICVQELGTEKALLPIMYEGFELGKATRMTLCRLNYTGVVPQCLTTCMCDRKCTCVASERPEPVDPDWLLTSFPAALLPAITSVGNPEFGSVPDDLKKVIDKREEEKQQREKNAQSSIERMETGVAEQQFLDVHQAWHTISPDIRRKKMESDMCERLQKDVKTEMSGDLRGMWGVIGSADHWHPNSEQFCKRLGELLAERLSENVALVAGGLKGVSANVARSYSQRRTNKQMKSGAFMVLPVADKSMKDRRLPPPIEVDGRMQYGNWDFGHSLHYGFDANELFDNLFNLIVMVMIEGGNGAMKQAMRSKSRGSVIVPMRCFGGAAEDMAEQCKSPFEEVERHVQEGGVSPFDWYEDARKAWECISEYSFVKGAVISETDIEKLAQAAALVVSVVIEHKKDLENLKQKAAGIPDPGLKPPGVKIFYESSDPSKDQFKDWVKYIKTWEAAVLFNGHGSRQQYQNMEHVKRILDFLVSDLNDKLGTDKWIVIYGGEPYLAGVSTISHPIRYLREKHNKVICMVQNDDFGKDLEAPRDPQSFWHMTDGAALIYKTETGIDNLGNFTTLFGGRTTDADGNVEMCGGTKRWFSDDVQLKGHIVLGGGAICCDEADLSIERGIPTFYAPCEAKLKPTSIVPSMEDWYGRIETIANEKHWPRHCWHPMPPQRGEDSPQS